MTLAGTVASGANAAPLVERLFGNDNAGFEGLKWMDASTIAELIHNEHPQIIASILVHLERDQACEILTLFTERLRNDVVLRIATLDGMQPSALIELNDVLRQMVSGGAGNRKKSSMGGVHVAAEILNFMPASIEGKLMEHLQQTDGDMAEKIMNEMFVFDNILEIDDRGIQVLLREVQTDSLVLALKGTTEDLRQKIFRNMSSRAAEALKEDLESRGPVKVAEVEAQQKEILKIVRRLGEEGQIQLGGKGEDSYV